MKQKEFFDLTKRTRAAQKLYYKTRLTGDLIAAKQLESQLDKAIATAIKDGGLEPDEPTATVQVFTTAEFQEQLRLVEEAGLYMTTVVSDDENRKLRLHLEDERDAGELDLPEE